MGTIILEFNEDAQQFHFNHCNSKEETNGWRTLARFENVWMAHAITDFLRDQFNMTPSIIRFFAEKEGEQIENTKVTFEEMKRTLNNLITFIHTYSSAMELSKENHI